MDISIKSTNKAFIEGTLYLYLLFANLVGTFRYYRDVWCQYFWGPNACPDNPLAIAAHIAMNAIKQAHNSHKMAQPRLYKTILKYFIE